MLYLFLAPGEVQRKGHIDSAETTGMPVTKKVRNAGDENTMETEKADVACID